MKHMIDVHCHLEQPDFDKDRDQLIEELKKELDAVITSAAHPKDFEKGLNIVKKHEGFVFLSVGIHPEYVKEIKEKEIEEFFEKVKENSKWIVSIGEIGLDYYWIKEEEWRKKQRELFSRLLDFTKEVKKPVTIHIREACEDAIKILEDFNLRTHLHMFGCRKQLPIVLQHENWKISENTIILTSKNYKKIVRDTPIEKLMLETDSPWLGFGKRNDPRSVKLVAQKIAEIKKMSLEEVDKITTKNAIEFFGLSL